MDVLSPIWQRSDLTLVGAPLLRRTAVRQHRRHRIRTPPPIWYCVIFNGRDASPRRPDSAARCPYLQIDTPPNTVSAFAAPVPALGLGPTNESCLFNH